MGTDWLSYWKVFPHGPTLMEENKVMHHFPFTQEGHPLKEGKLTRVSPFQNRIRIHGQEAPNKPRSATEKDVCQIMRSSAMQRLYKHCLTKGFPQHY